MVIEIIPAGSSAVVTDKHDRDDSRVLETLTNMAESDGIKYGNTVAFVKDAEADSVKTMKDAEAQLARQMGQHYADTVKTVKDSEANLDRTSGDRFMQTVQDVKDAETRLHEDLGEKFINIVQDVKDAETRLTKDAGDRFIDTIQDIKAADLRSEAAKGKVVETVREAEFEASKSDGKTRELVLETFAKLQSEHGDLKYHVKENQREMERLAYKNEIRNVEHFGKQALLSEKLALQGELHADRLAAAAAAKAAECCCELREAIRADGDRTRALINTLEQDHLRDRAAKAEGQLAAYFARGVAPVVP